MNGVVAYLSYQGMEQNAVTAMIKEQGGTVEFIHEKEYKEFINQTPPIVPK